MNALKLKVCGMRDPANCEQVAKLPIDFMGFIFYKDSPRFVGNDFVMPAIGPAAERVGVFVNSSAEQILQTAEAQNLRWIQAHGREPSTCIRAVKESGCGVIKAVGVSYESDVTQLEDYAPWVDYFLFDTKTAFYGGTGRVFDWTLLSGYTLPIPFFLSGGIGPDNITTVAALAHPQFAGIDVNSKVEKAPALKDVVAIKKISNELKRIHENDHR